MADDVLNPLYWKTRLDNCNGEPHRAMFEGSIDQMREIDVKQRWTLLGEIHDTDSVLDCGCGYGRLLTLMPCSWDGDYLGIDLCPDFIRLAKILHSKRDFVTADLRDLEWLAKAGDPLDVAVVSGVKGMVTRHCGVDVWDTMEREIRRVAKRVLILPGGALD